MHIPVLQTKLRIPEIRHDRSYASDLLVRGNRNPKFPRESLPFFAAYAHEIALAFFGHAQTGIVSGIGLLSIALWRARLYSRWLAGIGASMNALALVGLGAGVFGPHWRTFSTAGPMMLLFFVWELALGIAMLRYKPALAPSDASLAGGVLPHSV